MLEMYADPLFLLFPVMSLLIGVGAFLLFAVPLSWLAAKDPLCLSPYRLQKRSATAGRAFWLSLARLAWNLACMLALAVILWPLLRLSGVHAGDPPSWAELLWQLPLFLVLDDVGFYFLHRLLHTRWLYRRVHAVHHRMTTPTAIAGGYFHPVEYALINIVALAGPLAVGAHVETIWIWAVLRQWLAADGHSGYALPWNPGHLIPGYPGPSFHDWHHKRFVGNYANCFAFLDRWFGTLSPGYAEHRMARVPRLGALPRTIRLARNDAKGTPSCFGMPD